MPKAGVVDAVDAVKECLGDLVVGHSIVLPDAINANRLPRKRTSGSKCFEGKTIDCAGEIGDSTFSIA